MVHLSCQPIEHPAKEMFLNCRSSFWLIFNYCSSNPFDNNCKSWECRCSHRWL